LTGYRAGEYVLSLNDPCPDLFIRKTKIFNQFLERDNRVAGVYGPVRLENGRGDIDLAYFAPDQNWPWNQVSALIHRLGRKMPDGDSSFQLRYFTFAKNFIKTKFDRLVDVNRADFEEWVETTPYTKKRKEELWLLRQQYVIDLKKQLVSKCFVKSEGYQVPKWARGIYSPHDITKAFIGPIIHKIDKATFRTPQRNYRYFVKETKPTDWPKMLKDFFGDLPVMGSDFTAFESHHHDVFSEVISYWIEHVGGSAISEIELELVKRMILGTNYIEFKTVTAQLKQRLMSGSMWTSSANGMLNLTIMAFIATELLHHDVPDDELHKYVDDSFVGFVEGDDGICLRRGSSEQVAKIVSKLGIVLKFDGLEEGKFKTYNEMSFCGVITPDSETLPDGTKREPRIVTDPIKVLRNFFVLDAKYAGSKKMQMAIIRAKAMSYKFLYGDCPIVGALAWKTLQITRSYSIDPARDYINKEYRCYAHDLERELWTVKPVVSLESRLMIENMFGVSVDQQLDIERAIYSSTGQIIEVDLGDFSSPIDEIHNLNHLGEPGSDQPCGTWPPVPPSLLSAFQSCDPDDPSNKLRYRKWKRAALRQDQLLFPRSDCSWPMC